MALLTRWQEEQARLDRRTQQVVWILAEINRSQDKHPAPYTLDDFPLHRWGLVKDEAKPTTPPVTDEAVAWGEIGLLRASAAMVFGPAAAVIHNGVA